MSELSPEGWDEEALPCVFIAGNGNGDERPRPEVSCVVLQLISVIGSLVGGATLGSRPSFRPSISSVLGSYKRDLPPSRESVLPFLDGIHVPSGDNIPRMQT